MLTSGTQFGYRIESGLPLTRLGRGPAPRGTVGVELAEDRLPDPGEPILSHEFPEDGQRFALFRTAAGLLAQCSATGTFSIENARRRVLVQPGQASDQALEHRLLSTMVPLLLAELGELLIHAAAAVHRGRAILFCGPAGRGKSTLALALARTGVPLLTEDGALVSFDRDIPLTWPGASGVRTRPAADADKRVHTIASAQRIHDAVPIGAVVLLAERGGERAELNELSPAVGVRKTMPHVIAAGGPRLSLSFALTARLGRAVPMLAGRLPDDLSALPATAPDLLRMAGSFAARREPL